MHCANVCAFRAGVICICIGTAFLSVAGAAIYLWRDVLGYLFVDSAKVLLPCSSANSVLRHMVMVSLPHFFCSIIILNA